MPKRAKPKLTYKKGRDCRGRVRKSSVVSNKTNNTTVVPNETKNTTYNTCSEYITQRQLFSTGNEIKKKWNNLQHTYMQQIRENNSKMGQAEKIGKKWQCSEEMEVSHSILPLARTLSNVAVTSETQGTTENLPSEDHRQSQFLENIHEKILDTDTDNPGNAEASRVSATKLSNPSSAVIKKRKLEDEPPSSGNSLIEYCQNKTNPEMDETELLFLAHARSIKKLSNKNQAIVKMKIARIVMEQQLLDIEEQERSQDNSHRPSSVSSGTDTAINCTTTPSNYEYLLHLTASK